MLKVNKGPLYHIDSIRVYGKVKISNNFLQHYLGITNGSIYNIDKLQQVSKLLLQLPYLEEGKTSDLTMLGTGAILNLYFFPKRSNQADFLIGFAPAGNQTNKLLVTGQANLNLKNALGSGETILLNWQQLQQSSPRLNLGYQQPYIFNSSFGVDFSFDMFKKDSTYLQLNTQIGLQYLLSANQSGKIFLQDQSTILLASGIDTNLVIATKTLPSAIDANAVSVGINYDWNNTNYHFNPKTGNEFDIIASVGVKNIKKSNTILSIADTTFNYASLYDSLKLNSYQFRLVLAAAHYFPTGNQSTLKIAANIGIFNSQSIFQNDLFQIGGYKLLRGFDEQSIYATQYGVGTTEFRYLLGLNSYLFTFVDLGWVRTNYQYVNTAANFVGTGIGIEFERKWDYLISVMQLETEAMRRLILMKHLKYILDT
ncbi:MAG: BamA/TamA family outer membrane protein [Ferruginibacter sp.]